MSDFVGLHVHSEYSLLDGASQLPNLIDQAAELGMQAIALTDHGVMYGAIELIKICRSKGIKPIVGNEMYVINGDITKQEKKRKYHQIVLAKDTQGYKNLVKLTTISHLQGYQGKGIFARPCINKENLEKYKEGLVVTSGCLAGEVPQAILQGHPEIAREVAAWYKERFGDDYYLEIQDHGYPEDRTVNVEIVRIARELDIKLVATNDSHFVSCHDVEAHDALLCIQTGKLITELKRLRYSGAEYLKSVDEMKLLFRDHLSDDVIAEAISNTVEVAAKIKSYDIMSDPRAAEYPVPAGHTADTYLESVTWQGLLERFKTEHRSDIPDSYQQRMHYELQIMQQMGFATYFLVVWDYIKYARDRGIPVGPGRGSAAGSLVAYALGITNIDPIHHGLLFERFLNPERKSMPDIDTDFCIDHRDELIKYVTQRYGEDRVAQIVTFNRLTSKAVLKDVGRVLDVSYGEADKMAKMIPVFRGKPAKLKVMISDETPAPEFKERYEKDPKVFHWLDMAMRIEGVNKSSGVHAAGVVISPVPLDEIVPLQRNNDGAVITQYPMEDLESLGLLKMDFLGLRNLTTIQHTVDLIKQSHKDIEFDINAIAPDAPTSENEETYKLLGRGDLEGIFQLESSGMKQIVRDLKPSNIDDISSILALYRPGPLDAGLIPKFINRKHGREVMDYAHPDLEPILKETYSILVFQEQIMKIAQDLAGYTLGEADLLRRCLSGSTEVVDVRTGKLVSLQEIAKSPNYWLGREIFSLDLETQKIIQQPIVEIHPNGIREVWEVTTKTNRKIRATKDHLFYTLLGWQPLKSFKVGDRIGLVKILPITHTSDISDAQIKLSAYLIGDGHLSTKKPSHSYFCNSNSELVADFNNCCEQMFGSSAPLDHQLHPGRQTVTYARIGFISAFNQWVDNHLKRAHSRDKQIPAWAFTLSKKKLQLFLGTLWSTDGSFDIKIGHTDYTSTSETLIRQIQHLLLRLGIVGLFNRKRITYDGKPHVSYRVQVTGQEDMLKFYEIIHPYLSAYKQEKSESCYLVIKNKLKNQSKHTIPAEVISMIASAKHESGMTWQQIDEAVGVAKGTMSSGLNFQSYPTRSLSRHRIQNFATAFQSKQLAVVAESEVFWDEIISIDRIGQEEVFDLTIPETHNFIANDFIAHNCMGKKKPAEMEKQREKFLDGAARNGIKSKVATDLFDQMVLFAEYCFNKSHSVAYGYVTYQTAYLKANYPVEYMAALLSSVSGDQSKVQRYIASCNSMGIDILPPDVNSSGVDFTPRDRQIVFGLAAIKNLGAGAIESILAVRDREGKFKTLADLCSRVDSRALNKKALEALIQTGALDSMQPNRHQLMSDLEITLEWASRKAKEQASGQASLFDLFAADTSSNNTFDDTPSGPKVEDYPSQEKLRMEKELLGFYISDHPLKVVGKSAKLMAPINLSELADCPENTTLTAIILILDIKDITTKKGDRMAVLQVEDLTGSSEAVIFPKTYEKVRSHLQKDNRLMVWGKLDRRDDRVQLIIEDMQPIESVRMVRVELSQEQAMDIQKLHQLREVLKAHQSGETEGAKVPVIAALPYHSQMVRLGNQFWVTDDSTAVAALTKAGFKAIPDAIANS